MTTKEFKVDKLGFYRTKEGDLALVDYIRRVSEGYVKERGQRSWDLDGKYLYSNNDYYEEPGLDLIEFIAPFDVWEYAKELGK